MSFCHNMIKDFNLLRPTTHADLIDLRRFFLFENQIINRDSCQDQQDASKCIPKSKQRKGNTYYDCKDQIQERNYGITESLIRSISIRHSPPQFKQSQDRNNIENHRSESRKLDKDSVRPRKAQGNSPQALDPHSPGRNTETI